MKPLFIPLNSKPYEQFANGRKTHEFRRYGARWNETTCTVGRPVLLSRGYGKWHRMSGQVSSFICQHGTAFSANQQREIIEVYGTVDILIACIGIKNLTQATI